jgi:hypothetical protein
LASRSGQVQPKKGKDYEIAQWEANLRKSLAERKPSTEASLTKQERALVQAQLEKEALIRQRVTSIKANLERGLDIVRCLIAAGIHEFRSCISSLVPLLLEGAFRGSSMLVGRKPFDTYLVILFRDSGRHG